MKHVLQYIAGFAHRNKRLAGGVWFALMISIFPFFWFGDSSLSWFRRGDFQVPLMYLVAPFLSAGIAGGIYGYKILVPSYCDRQGNAVLRGLLTALLTYPIFAPLFALSASIFEPSGTTHFAGLFTTSLLFGPILSFPAVLPMGGFAGWLLFKLSSNFQNIENTVDSDNSEIH